MSKKDILEYFTVNNATLTPLRILFILFLALAGSLVIYAVYRVTCRKELYNAGFNQGNMLLTLITTVIMMMISSNIVISLGMVGALSIVRFRTAVKNARDTIFVFWSMVLGLCVGSQNYMLALLSTLFIGAVAVAQSLLPQGFDRYTLIIRGSGVNEEELRRTVAETTRRCRLDSTCFSGDSGEWVYAVNLKSGADPVSAVRALPGVQQVDLVSALTEG